MGDFYVYGLYDPTRSRVFYVGKGKGGRMNVHLSQSGRGANPHKDRIIDKIRRSGAEPVAYKIADELSEDEAYDLEHLIITEEFDRLANICRNWGSGVGSGASNPMYGRNHSEKTRERMSKAIAGEAHHYFGKSLSADHRSKLSESNSGDRNPFYGRTHSDESKARMSESSKGKTHDLNTRRKIRDGTATLREDQAAEVRWLARHSDLTQSEIGDQYGIDRSTVSQIKHENSWKGVKPIRPTGYN